MGKLTKRFVDSIGVTGKDEFYWDDEIPGFGLRLSKRGVKTYVYKYRIGKGRSAPSKRAAIGKHGELTPDTARDIAKNWAAQARQGIDPLEQMRISSQQETVAEFCDRYLREHAEVKKKASSVYEDKRLIEAKIKPAIGRLMMPEVTRQNISKLHHQLRTSPYQANRVLSLLSKIFNLAESWDIREEGTNPCRHVQRYKEEKRARILSAVELAALGEALRTAERKGLNLASEPNGRIMQGKENPYAVAAIRLLMLTGARLSEILTAQWDWIDWDRATLDLPDSKTGAKSIHLSAPALAVLAAVARVNGNPYVIVGAKEGEHLKDLQRPWRRIRKAAGLPSLRIHDLRHAFISIGAQQGDSLVVLGAIAGHSNQATTQRYAHLNDDPVKATASKISEHIQSAMLKGGPGKV